ncbi:MAG: ExbD/TolR family protein [bacterium]|nr:ExbD/TolR family protein [bacterium]
MNKYHRKSISEINVTSLVDVTMVLLIIFMITAPLLRSGIEVELPKSNATDLQSFEGVVVTIDKQGQLNINGEMIQSDQFEKRLLQKYSHTANKTVLLQADKSIAYGHVIKVMDRIKKLGIHNLGLIVEPEIET